MKTIELFNIKKRQRRRKKWRRAGIILVSIALCTVVLGFVADNVTLFRFPDLYEAIWYFEKIGAERIEHIIYSDTTATVLYQERAGVFRSLTYYEQDGYWTFVNCKSQLVSWEGVGISIARTIRGGDWYASLSVTGPQDDVIYDSIQTEFFCYYSDSFRSRYCAVIHPDSEDYSITINGETYHIKLKHYG